MSKIFAEQDLSLSVLGDHLEDAGWDVQLEKERLLLHSERGLGFSLWLDIERQFVMLSTYLPIREDFSDRLALANRCNHEVFLGNFYVDGDGDLVVSYAMTFERGLILAQLTRIVLRFGSMLDHVLRRYDPEGSIFDFGEGNSLSEQPSLPSTLQ